MLPAAGKGPSPPPPTFWAVSCSLGPPIRSWTCVSLLAFSGSLGYGIYSWKPHLWVRCTRVNRDQEKTCAHVKVDDETCLCNPVAEELCTWECLQSCRCMCSHTQMLSDQTGTSMLVHEHIQPDNKHTDTQAHRHVYRWTSHKFKAAASLGGTRGLGAIWKRMLRQPWDIERILTGKSRGMWSFC